MRRTLGWSISAWVTPISRESCLRQLVVHLATQHLKWSTVCSIWALVLMSGPVVSFSLPWSLATCHSKTNQRLSCTKKSSAVNSRCLSASQLAVSIWLIRFLKRTLISDWPQIRLRSTLGTRHISLCARAKDSSLDKTRFPLNHPFSDISNAMVSKRTMQLSVWIETSTTRWLQCIIYFSSA